MEPQKALETATVNRLRLSLGYSENECNRTFMGRPPPGWKLPFISVWSYGDVKNPGAENTFLREVRGIEVTVSIPIGEHVAYDRWVANQDDLEVRMNRIVEIIHLDCDTHWISNAAEELASLGDGTSHPVGFTKGLVFLGSGRVQEAGPSWWKAKRSSGVSGIVQQASFGLSTRIRNFEGLV